jgi:hypothetical protein
MGIFTIVSAAVRKSTDVVSEVVMHTDGERVIKVSKEALGKVGITGVGSTLEKGLGAASVVEGAIYKGIGIGFRAIKAGIKEQELRHASNKEEEPEEADFVVTEEKTK